MWEVISRAILELMETPMIEVVGEEGKLGWYRTGERKSLSRREWS